jgi:ankyrin repeat protein
MNNHSSPMLSSVREVTRGLRCCYHLVACGIVLLVAIWPTGDPDPHPQTTAMSLAAGRGDVVAMDCLLRSGLNVDCTDEYGMTPLMTAARAGQLGAVQRLLAAGARIDACSPLFGTPLMLAALYTHHQIMHELIEHGAHVDAANKFDRTALWHARVSGDNESVRILIAAGAIDEGKPDAP